MDDSLPAMLADTSRVLRRAFDSRAREIGVTRPQWRVLVTLHREEGINQGGLADLLDVEPITVCRMVDRMQEAGLVERRPDPADRRSWRLFLTGKARSLLEQLRPLANDMLREAFDGLSARDLATVKSALDRIRSNLARPASDPQVAHG